MKYTPLIALCLLIGCVAPLEARAQKDRPNIVFIMADDLGYGDLGVTGSDDYRTPNIDKLATESMVFNAAYANCANCAPTRAALMSGMYAPRTGVYTVGSPERGRANDRRLIPAPNKTELAPGFVTIAEVLKQAGYTTAHMGKWHLGSGETGPRAQGFDVNIGGGDNGHPRSFFSPYRNVDHIPDSPEGEYLTDRLTREAVDFMAGQKQSDTPFFLYLPLYTVHTPIQPQQRFIDAAASRDKGEHHDHVKYAAMVESMDHYVGRILDAIDEHGFGDNTLVVFTSDNGGHGGYTDHAPLRGSKGMFYEGGIRVPLFVRYPGLTTAGASCDEPVVLLDFYPTLTELAGAGLPADQPVDGLSLLPLFRDPDAELQRDAIYFHFPAYLQGYRGGEMAEAQRPPWRATPCGAIRASDWKLIEYFETGDLELFNLKEDAGEQNDLSKAMPEKTRSLHAMMRTWREQTNAPVPAQKNPRYKGE